MKTFKGFLAEEVLIEKTKLDYKDLSKFRNGSERGQIIHAWIKDKKPVKIDDVEKTLEYISTNHADAMKSGNYSYFKDGNRNLPIWSDGRTLYKITDLDKTSEFGGGKGSGAGSDITDITESAQCVYAQTLWDGSEDFTMKDLTSAYSKVDVDRSLDEVLNISDAWRESCILGAKVLKKGLGKNTYKFHKGSKWVKNLQDHYAILNKRAGSPFKNINKWTPADIWLLGTSERSYNLLQTESLIELNAKLQQAFKERQIVGSSLKQMSDKAHIEQVNYRAFKKIPHYTGRTVGKTGFYNAKDVYIYFGGGEIQFRTFPDSWQAEIKGEKANMGKMSHGPINTVLKLVGIPKFITNQVTLRTLIKKNRPAFMKKLHALAKKEAGDHKRDSLKIMTEKLQDKDVNWLVSKYCGLELFSIMKGEEDKVTGGMLSYASSQSDLSAPFLKLM